MAANNNATKINKTAASGNGVINFFKELKAEIKRITWASKENVKKATATVLIFCTIYVAVVGLLDVGFKSLIEVIFK